MRWLHTSDWHLGRNFHGESLLDTQQEMLDTVLATVDEHAVDVVLVAGDIYDRALPPTTAVTQLERTLEELVARGVQAVMISGNHDSAQRLGFGRGLMSSAGVHLRTSLEDAWRPVEFTSESRDPVSGETLREVTLVYGLPYLEPVLVAAELGVAANHTSVIAEVVRRIWEDVEKRRSELGNGTVLRTVLMAHLFAARGVGSDSERNIGVEAPAGEALDHTEHTAGGLAVVPLETFEGFDYVALGHLHGRQQLSPTVRYSGSPIRYSFSEVQQAKGAWLWDSQDWEDITAVDWAVGRPMAVLRGGIEEVLEQAVVAEHSESYVQVTLTDPVRPEQAFQRVREAYPHLLRFSHAAPASSQAAATYASVLEHSRDDIDLIESFLSHVRQRPANETERALLAEALETVRVARGTGGH